MRIGDWNEIAAVSSSPQPCAWRPSGELQGAYADFWHIARNLLYEERLLVSIDNSTFARIGEVEAFYECLGLSSERCTGELHSSFIAKRSREHWSNFEVGRLSLLLLFSTAVEWHVHFASVGETGFRRVSVLDGTLFSFSSEAQNSIFDDCIGYHSPS